MQYTLPEALVSDHQPEMEQFLMIKIIKSKCHLTTISNDERGEGEIVSAHIWELVKRGSAGMVIRGLEELSPNSLCFMVDHCGPCTRTNTNTNETECWRQIMKICCLKYNILEYQFLDVFSAWKYNTNLVGQKWIRRTWEHLIFVASAAKYVKAHHNVKSSGRS